MIGGPPTIELRCPNCAGSGKANRTEAAKKRIEPKDCPDCGGSGTIVYLLKRSEPKA